MKYLLVVQWRRMGCHHHCPVSAPLFGRGTRKESEISTFRSRTVCSLDRCRGAPGPVYGREMNVFRPSVTALIISAALAMAAPAHADGDSYIRYLNDHGIFVPQEKSRTRSIQSGYGFRVSWGGQIVRTLLACGPFAPWGSPK